MNNAPWILLSILSSALLVSASLARIAVPLNPNNAGSDLTIETLSEPVVLQGTAALQSQDLIVVRAYYTDPQKVGQIARWKEPWEVHPQEGYLVIGLTPQELPRLQEMGLRLLIDQTLTEQVNAPAAWQPEQTSGIPSYPCYRTLEETYASARSLAETFPGLAAWIDIGDSWEKSLLGDPFGSDLMVLKLTNSALNGDKPVLFIMASVHAREYTPAELVTRFAEYLLQNYGKDADVTWLLDHNEIHLLLQANPDGRKLAETRLISYRMWRKNTNQAYCAPDSSSRGADLNRNFDFQWGCCNGASTYECDDTYRGAFAASEPEILALQNYLRSVFPDQRQAGLNEPAPDSATGVFLDVHSYGNLILWPWGFTSNPPPNNAALQRLGTKLAFFNQYEPDQAITLYPTSGAGDDFAYGDLGVASYTFELGSSFFENCSSFENTVLPENIPALIYAAKVARSPYQLPSGPDITGITISPPVVHPGMILQLTAQVDDSRYFAGYIPPVQLPPIDNIQKAEFYIDIPPWVTATLPISYTLAPQDGSFDQSQELVVGSFDSSGLNEGRHTIFFRAKDSAGNWGPFSAAFFHIPSLFFPWVAK